MRIAAITGSIGCGKSTLAKIVRDLGYAVFDIDAWVRQIYYKREFLNELYKIFQDSFEDGKVNKRYIRNLVFNDKNKLDALENIIYPFLEKKIKKLIHKNAGKNYWCFLDIALLFEKNWDRYCDFIILADVDYEIQKNRVIKRDKISAEDFDKINNIQLQNEAKKLLSDVVVDTDKQMNQLKVELLEIVDGLENC